MKVSFIDHWTELQSFLPYLQKKEIAHNLAIGLITSKREKELIMAAAFYRDEEDEPIMLLLQTIKEQAVLSVFEELTDLEIQECATTLARQTKEVPGIIGEIPYVEWFSMQYSTIIQQQIELNMAQRIYQLTEVRPPDSVLGKLREAKAEERPLLVRWALQFAKDAGISLNEEEAETRVSHLLRENALYVWENEGQMVSMAAATRPTRSNINISFVFTPADFRKNGYASACVAALCGRLLEGRYTSISLYTDLANPTSNHIYQEIGFKQRLDSKLILFK
ncbi:GNAT family N-acetyltransferase [Alkalicoccobacillus porphyridii]|uniref:GNAT family N-acetyltransferase n=1 Tax=Alkalicoccobacillus porphyridii TaxID=2597270 RepID=A0A553ZTG5_9BACI|nr:GNAT family N-acetyltransferase [Alkalicoccobacillus porphyridii]TSB44693.1 GNAT family N-acetyltransferase [Alkalicoccobacillus porphyridii]